MGTPGVPAPHPLEPRSPCLGVLLLPQLPGGGGRGPALVGQGHSPFAVEGWEAPGPKQMNECLSSASCPSPHRASRH